MQTLMPTPPSDRHGRDRQRGPGLSSCDCRNFWPRAFRRAANPMRIFQEKRDAFWPEAGAAGSLWSAPVNPPEGRHVASIRLDQSPLRRDQLQGEAVVALALHQRGIGRADLSAICDIEIASSTLRGLARRRRGRRRRDAKSCAFVRTARVFGFADVWTHVFARSVTAVPVRRR
jgi:hypothetical protein